MNRISAYVVSVMLGSTLLAGHITAATLTGKPLAATTQTENPTRQSRRHADPSAGTRGDAATPVKQPESLCDYWNTIDLDAWDAEMDRMFETFQGIEVTADEVESAWLMDFESSKARWPGNERQAREMTRPRRTLRNFLRKEKYQTRHSRELTDEEVRQYQRMAPATTVEEVRKLSDLSLKISMARNSVCGCECRKPKMKEICTFGVYYENDMARIYVPEHWKQNACFDERLLPDGAMEP